jgi:hypothetical protein
VAGRLDVVVGTLDVVVVECGPDEEPTLRPPLPLVVAAAVVVLVGPFGFALDAPAAAISLSAGVPRRVMTTATITKP